MVPKLGKDNEADEGLWKGDRLRWLILGPKGLEMFWKLDASGSELERQWWSENK